MGKIEKESILNPHKLRRKHKAKSYHLLEFAFSIQKKEFPHKIIIGDKKWIFFDNPKHRKASVDLDQAAMVVAKPNVYGTKALLCVCWDQKRMIHNELLKPGQTVTVEHYFAHLMGLRSFTGQGTLGVLLLHENSRPHTAGTHLLLMLANCSACGILSLI